MSEYCVVVDRALDSLSEGPWVRIPLGAYAPRHGILSTKITEIACQLGWAYDTYNSQ